MGRSSAPGSGQAHRFPYAVTVDRSLAGLQAAVFLDDPDIPLKDGLLDPVDPPAGLPIHFGGRAIPRPVGEHRPPGSMPAKSSRWPRPRSSGRDSRVPPRVRSARHLGSGAPWRSGGMDQGAVGVEHDRHPNREAAPEIPGRPMVDPLAQDPALNAECLKGGHLLRFGRQPRQVEMGRARSRARGGIVSVSPWKWSCRGNGIPS